MKKLSHNVIGVQCDNTLCGAWFPLVSPDCILEMVLVDEEDNEMGPREPGFACPKCIKRYMKEDE